MNASTATASADARGWAIAIPAGLGMLATSLQLLGGLRIDPINPFTLIFPLSIPIGALLGARHAHAVLRHPALPMGRMSLAAMEALVIGILAIAVINALAGLAAGDPVTSVLPMAAVIVVYGLLIFGLPIYIGVVAFATISGLLLRWVVGRGYSTT